MDVIACPCPKLDAGLVNFCWYKRYYHWDPWWRHQMETYSALLAICAGNSPVPRKGQWRGALMFSLIYVWINGWVNNREAGDLRRYRAHYDVTVMLVWIINYIHMKYYCRHHHNLCHLHGCHYHRDDNPSCCSLECLQDCYQFYLLHYCWWLILLLLTVFSLLLRYPLPLWSPLYMTTSSNGSIFRVTCHLCGETTGHRWIPSDADLWCSLWFAPEQTVEQAIVTPVISDAIAFIMTSLQCIRFQPYWVNFSCIMPNTLPICISNGQYAMY